MKTISLASLAVGYTRPFGTFLLLIFLASSFSSQAQSPVLGSYANTTISFANNGTSVTPSAAPSNTSYITATTSTAFKGSLLVNPVTGVVRILNAYPAGTYTIKVNAFNGTGTSSTSFILTVGSNVCSNGSFAAVAKKITGGYSYSIGIADFNADGTPDFITADPPGTAIVGFGQPNSSFVSYGISLNSTPYSVAIADFNGDGIADFVTANAGIKRLSIGMGNGNGTFFVHYNVQLTDYSYGVVTGDFNGDGRADIAVAHQTNNVSIMLGNGQGNFSPPIMVAVGASPFSIAIGDFNGDGNVDFATANSGGNTVSIRLGNGSGGFSGSTEVVVGQTPNSVVVGDLNGDGKDDIATANYYSNTVSIRLGDGFGGFSGSTDLVVGTKPSSVVIGDFNGDEKTDLAIANEGSNTVSILLGNGIGGVGDKIEVATDAQPRSMAIGDFNGDGIADFINSNLLDKSVSTWQGTPVAAEIQVQGNGTDIASGNSISSLDDHTDFGTEASVRTYTIQNKGSGPLRISNIVASGTNASLFTVGGISLPATVAAGGSTSFKLAYEPAVVGTHTATITVNNDDCDEASYAFAVAATAAVVVPTLGMYQSVMVGAANGGTVAAPSAPPILARRIVATTTGNFKGTLLADPTTGMVRIVNAHPAGTYAITVKAFNVAQTASASFMLTVGSNGCGKGNFANLSQITTGAGPAALAIGDFNGDGKPDIAAAIQGTNALAIRLGNGLGGFSSSPDVAVGTKPKSLAIGDFNADGRADVAAANYDAGTASIRLGNGAGGFSGGTDLSMGVGASSIAIGDFNGDGKADIAVANFISNTVSIRLGDGRGGFGGITNVAAGAGACAVAIGDFNGDGKVDMAVANETAHTVSILLGDGLGGFGAISEITSVGEKTRSVAIGDFNGDGKADIAIASYTSNAAYFYKGDGTGGFGPPTTTTVGTGPSSVAIGDFNGDGKVDAVTANSGANTISVLLGDGLGAFTRGTDLPFGTNPTAIAVGDFNGDGKADIAGTSSNQTVNAVNIRLGVYIEISVKGNGADIAKGSGMPSLAKHTDFGYAMAGSSLARTYTIQNTGTEQMLVSNIAASGTDAALFTVGGIGLPATVAAGGSATFTVTYAPVALGVHTATITIGNDDCDEGSYDFAIAGRNSSLGDYANTIITHANGNATIIPSTAPMSVSLIAVSTSIPFKGNLRADPGTGVISIGNAYPAGTYTITVRAFNAVETGIASFTLTVGNNACSEGAFAGSTNVAVGASPSSMAIADFNGDGKADMATANFLSSTVSISMGDGAGNFSASTDVAVGSGPWKVVAGDLNGDGKADIATANYNVGTVSVRLGNGAGGFTGSTEVPVGANPYSLAIGDFNGDGYADLAAANEGSNTVSIRLGDGAGGFSGNTEVAVGTKPSSVTVSDFNGDGKADLATANNTANTLSIRMGDGLGGFSGSTEVPAGQGPISVAAADFNDDGNADIAIANFNGNSVYVRLGNGAGGFSGSTNLSVGSGPNSVTIGDFNGDGKADFATAGYFANSVSIMLGNGLGTFTSTGGEPVGSHPVSIAIADFDGDGRADFAASNADANSVSIKLGATKKIMVLGNGTAIAKGSNAPSLTNHTDFGALEAGSSLVRTYTIQNAGNSPLAIGTIAVSGANGSLFAISGISLPATVASGGSSTFTVTYTSVGVGQHTAIITIGSNDCDKASYDFAVAGIGIGPTLGNYANTTVAYANGSITVTPSSAPTYSNYITATTGSSFKGTLLANPATGVISVANAHPAGTYTIAVRASNTAGSASTSFTLTVGNNTCSQGQFNGSVNLAVGSGPYSVATGDFNGDGKSDLAVVNFNANNVSIRLGDGLGGFSAGTNVSSGSGPVSVATGDFNGDGNTDFATANAVANTVSIRLGDGAGSFSNGADVPVGVNPQPVAIGDFNGDGNADFVTANYVAGTVSIRLGDGAGGFGGGTEMPVGTNPVSVAIGDFNGDGKADLATANTGSSNVSIRLGDGAGGFSGSTNVVIGTSPYSVAIGDFNGDGKVDFATANNAGNSVSIRLGDGLGGFTTASNVSVGATPSSIAIGDFNGDGKVDIATVNYSSNNVSVRLGNGLGGFSGSTEVAVGTNPRSLTIGDFNDDGRTDFAAANYGAASVSVWLGAASEINLQGDSADIAKGSGSPVWTNHTSFGDVTTGGSLVRTYTIQNTGEGPLAVTNIVSGGADASLFMVGGISLPATVSAGGSTTFTVTYAPVAAGTHAATITITNDDCDEANYDFVVVGTGIICSTPTAAVLSGGGAYCASGTANLQVDITGGSSPFTVTYGDGSNDFTLNGYISGGDIPVSPNVTTSYSLVAVTGADGCPGTGNSGGATVAVTQLSTWYLDADNDGHYISSQTSCSSPGAGYNETAFSLGDCDDTDDGKWQSSVYYVDIDNDGFTVGPPALICFGDFFPVGYSPISFGEDCNDNDASIQTPQMWFLDADNDGYYVSSVQSCVSPGAGYNSTATTLGDCNDADNTKWRTIIQYRDADGDGYTVGSPTQVCYGTTIPAGYRASSLGADCDDQNAAAHAIATWYLDADNDGYYTSSQIWCGSPGVGYNQTAITLGDCDDADDTKWQSASLYVDADVDGYTVGPAVLVCYGATIPSGYALTSLGIDCDDNNASVLACMAISYRSFITGNFGTPGTWEHNTGSGWQIASAPPGVGDDITIQSGHTITLDINYTVGNNLQLQAGSSLIINPNKTLSVTGTAHFNGQPVIVRSTAAGTGSIGEIAGTLDGVSNVTVERYIPNSGRRWRLLTIPVAGPGIRQAWAEGRTPITSTGAVANEPGSYGTIITGNYTASAPSPALGFDWWPALGSTATASIRRYTQGAATGDWNSVPAMSTNGSEGYLLFIRGDRKVTSGSSATTLRATGGLKSGASVNVDATKSHTLVGNPFASAIDFEKVAANSGNPASVKADRFWVWDATVGGTGGYRLVHQIGAGQWERVPDAVFGTGPATAGSQYIQSSQAFFVEPNGGGSFVVNDDDKASVSGSVPNLLDAKGRATFHTNLTYDNGGALSLADGVLSSFGAGGSNGVGNDDVAKVDNLSETIALFNTGKKLALEARATIGLSDTVYLRLGNLTARSYALQFKVGGLPEGLTAFLLDGWLGKQTVLPTGEGAVSSYPFTVTSAAGSYAADRFKIVLSNPVVLPTLFIHAKAYTKDGGTRVEWEVGNEDGIKQYEVEKSTDGSNFASIGTIPSNGSKSYSLTDAHPQPTTDNSLYYRIKAVGFDGTMHYSAVLKLKTENSKLETFSVFPNPVKDGMMTLQLGNLKKGRYTLSVYNDIGQRVLAMPIEHLSGSASQSIKLGSRLAAGVYKVSMGNGLEQTVVVER